jgi:hypothetical protein
MAFKKATQLSMFDTAPVKQQSIWSIYAVPRYYDGYAIEYAIKAYSEKQARFLFHKLRDPQYQYMITGCYAVN